MFLVVNEVLGEVVMINAENVEKACETLMREVMKELSLENVVKMLFNETLVIDLKNGDSRHIPKLNAENEEDVDTFINAVAFLGKAEELLEDMGKVFGKEVAEC